MDDAIVVRENITRHLHMGKSHIRAALDGTNEIGLAVIATTATIVAVFLPVAFMDGIVGRFFYEFGITVSAAVLISLSSPSRSIRCCRASGTIRMRNPTPRAGRWAG